VTVAGLAPLLSNGLLIWLAALAAITLCKVTMDPERLRGLLCSRPGEDDWKADRLQLLIVVGLSAGGFLLDLRRSLEDGLMPEVPEPLLFVLAGSQAVYLSGNVTRYEAARRQNEEG
jgi:hypothetical protein